MARIVTSLLVLLLVAPLARAQEPGKEEKQAKISLSDFEDAFLEVADHVRPGVVAIEVRHGDEDNDAHDLLFSGVVWDSEGTIVALGRDLESAQEILVSPFEGEAIKARFIGVDDETGICVLKVDGAPPRSFKALEHGPVDRLRAGSFCVAVGNPVGLRHSVAFGHVAATGRSVRRGSFVTKDAIQVTLPVNPGDPGGLLADSRGRLVGVLSSSLRRTPEPGGMPFERELRDLLRQLKKFGQEKGEKGEKGEKSDDIERNARALRHMFEPNVTQLFTQNVSFAIPVDGVAKAVERVRSSRGKPWLGVDVRPLDDDTRDELGIEGGKGVFVSGVRAGSPAAKANLQAKDIVLIWNKEPVKGPRELQKLVLATAPGTAIKLEVLRGKELLTLDVTVEARGDSKPTEEKK